MPSTKWYPKNLGRILGIGGATSRDAKSQRGDDGLRNLRINISAFIMKLVVFIDYVLLTSSCDMAIMVSKGDKN